MKKMCAFSAGRFLLLSMLTMMFALSISAVHAAECERPTRLRFSLVPQSDVQTDITAMQPLFDELHITLVMPVDVMVPSSYCAVIEGMLAATVDLARLGPAAYISAKKQDPGITPFATVTSKTPTLGNEDIFYHSVLIVRNDSPAVSSIKRNTGLMNSIDRMLQYLRCADTSPYFFAEDWAAFKEILFASCL